MLTDRLSYWASAEPAHLAVAIGADHLTYGQLVRSAVDIAGKIQAHRGRRTRFGEVWNQPLVAVSFPNSTEFVRAFVATTLSGAAVAVLDPTWPTTQFESVLELLQPDLVITADLDLARRSREGGARTLSLVDIQSGTTEAGSTGAESLTDLVAPDPLSRFLIGFTSGTTSRPKAFVRSHQSWIESLHHSESVFSAKPDSVTLAPGPLAHGFTLYTLTESLFSGGTFVGLPRFDPHSVHVAARRHGPTRFVGVPTMYQRTLEVGSHSEWLSEVDTYVASGSKMPPTTLNQLFEAAPRSSFLEYYGASELSFVSVTMSTAARGPNDLDTTDVGTAFPGVDIEVRDAEGRRLPEGEIGTVFVRSALTSDGYLTPENSGFRRTGQWCTVGDTGYLQDVNLHILGREGDMVIIGGNNIYPSEIEAALLSHNEITQACVVAVDDPRRGRKLVAVLAEAESVALDVHSLLEHLRFQLPKYKLPHELSAIGRWPLTSSGKVNHNAVREWYVAQSPQIRRLSWN